MFEADAKPITFMMDSGVVRIPFFQRRYVWKEENWSELYDNFFGADTPGFLGSIILKATDRTKVYSSLECSVVDGQQRLTTVSIFLMALYDSLNENDKRFYFTDLVNVIFRKTNQASETGEPIYVPRIVHSHLDKDEFDHVIRLNATDKIKEGSKSLINNCYKYFYECFINEDYDKRKKILQALITDKVEILVVISISGDADEQKVFDTLNSAGVRLTMADTIKNNLFNKVGLIVGISKENDDRTGAKLLEKVINIYENTWKKHFCETDELDVEWNKEMVTGRIKRTNIDMFLHCFATIKGIYNPTQTLADLPNAYKEYIDGIENYEDMSLFLSELCEYADLYRENFIDTKEDYKYIYSTENVLPRLLLFEDTIGTKTFNPYILFLLKKYAGDLVKLNDELHKIEKIIVLTYLNKNTSRSKNYNKLCVDFIKNENRIDEELNQEDILDTDSGYVGLTRINNNEAKILLFMIELYRRSDPKCDIHDLEYRDTYQLEHIMPQKWQKYWNILPEKNDAGEPLMDIESKVNYRDSKVKSLGNMTILQDKLNNSISNASFEAKINGDGKHFGVRRYADFKITSEDVVEYFDHGGVWDEARINYRTKMLFEQLKQALLY